jgi:hypothetical protein
MRRASAHTSGLQRTNDMQTNPIDSALEQGDQLTKCHYLRTGDGNLQDVTDVDAEELELMMNGDACLIPAGSTTVNAIYNEAANLGWTKEECDELTECED